jgi:hypothetical protein
MGAFGQGQLSMINFKSLSLLFLAGTFMSSAALAADMDTAMTRAVSAPNGKIELGGGWADLDVYSPDNTFYGAASFSMPLGDTFGFQADLAVDNAFGLTAIAGAAHVFTRDPNSYLLGAYGGYADFGNATGAWIGPEAELYLDKVSFEGTAGLINVMPNSGGSQNKLFAFGDFGFYATDNFRLTVGASSIAGFESAHAGMEWLMGNSGLPISFKTDAQFGENNYYNVTAGISIYFGGESKTLIKRHREDDPKNRGLDIFQSGGLGLGAAHNAALPDCVNYNFETGTYANEPCSLPTKM